MIVATFLYGTQQTPTQASPSPHFKTETDPFSETFSGYVKFRTMDKSGQSVFLIVIYHR